MLLATSLAAPGGPAAAQLTETEQRLVAAVKERSPAALQLLERVVRVNSGTLNVEGVRAAGEVFRAEFEALGFATRWAEMPSSMRRAGHLVATRPGKQGKRLLLMGHIDTVFEKESAVPAWDPAGERVRGQGVLDMKGGIVVMLEALRALQGVGTLDGAAISVILTGDEERVGRPAYEARADVVELAKASDAALSFEAAGRIDGRSAANISRRSSGGWTLRVNARSGHSSRVFSDTLGHGAIYEGVRILDEFRRNVPEPGVTLNPGLVMGGTEASFDRAAGGGSALGKNNIIAREFVASGDLRYVTPEQGARRLLEAYSRASEDAGLGPVEAAEPDDRGSGDVQFAAPYVAGIDGLGVSGSGAHTEHEHMEVASLERGAVRAALLIYRLTRGS